MTDEANLHHAGPRLDPMSPPEIRARFVQNLKAEIAAGSYEVATEDIAEAVIADDSLFSRPR